MCSAKLLTAGSVAFCAASFPNSTSFMPPIAASSMNLRSRWASLAPFALASLVIAVVLLGVLPVRAVVDPVAPALGLVAVLPLAPMADDPLPFVAADDPLLPPVL